MSTDVICRELDVRPILREGGEPFPAIMDAVRALQPGEGLRLLATFQPVPLLSVMARRGYSAKLTELEGGDWEVVFSPAPEASAKILHSLGAEEAAAWPDPLWRVDLTELEPPGPMEKVLSLIELMEPGEVLFALFSDESRFLAAELEKRGHQWVGNVDATKGAYRMLIRVGGEG
ncbi:DUF2249 domain-containing protein [Peteryoungia ipomoeae]|uniref:DUF2249 domain-containing protein n=1 Tax=Peteryoungia ipomoeae TaxID=1210932 RepID=A0A4S8NSL3_9HYPH|nr:DUF2249 domain-containing protein [Peteryoungia ipomoeae]THV20188.1 DUF2249 domain-containing protein [Peteryoungia ipomoeae]